MNILIIVKFVNKKNRIGLRFFESNFIFDLMFWQYVRTDLIKSERATHRHE